MSFASAWRFTMTEVRKRLLIACSCLLLGSVEVLVELFGAVASR
ncbi:hypothetical protein ACPOL_3671 [Acidisarcina polymorpha]|uniref:Uncharacterized protein n=1 Tax=Acidisarcina polymorpha TaxID=2211140 RepID=A0A2Z5G1K6_9BACT|nr:hypothetical protein ACPOL_3671 [Acidisarcina polymorpha]